MSTSKMALKRFMSETQDTLKQYIILPVNSAVWYSVGMELVTQRSAKHCHFIRDWMGHSTGQWQVLTMTDGEYFTLLQAFTTAFSHFCDFVKHTLLMASCESMGMQPKLSLLHFHTSVISSSIRSQCQAVKHGYATQAFTTAYSHLRDIVKLTLLSLSCENETEKARMGWMDSQTNTQKIFSFPKSHCARRW